MPNLAALSLELILLAISFIWLSLYLREYFHNRFNKDSSHVLEEAKLKSFDIIQNAAKQAQEILAKAETDSLKLSTDNKEIVKNLEQTLSSRTNLFFEQFETNLSNYLTSTQQQSVKAIELELQSARNLIDTYKTTQFNLIDENIIAMLERTLSLVLVKKMTLKDQVDLVYESLEQAKAEKFLV